MTPHLPPPSCTAISTHHHSSSSSMPIATVSSRISNLSEPTLPPANLMLLHFVKPVIRPAVQVLKQEQEVPGRFHSNV